MMKTRWVGEGRILFFFRCNDRYALAVLDVPIREVVPGEGVCFLVFQKRFDHVSKSRGCAGSRGNKLVFLGIESSMVYSVN